MSFRILSIVELTAGSFVYHGVAIVLAVLGCGVWSLVFSFVIQHTLALIWLRTAAGRTTSSMLSWASVVPLLRYSTLLILSRLASALARNADSMVVGLKLNAADVGIYNRAYRVGRIPSDVLASTFGAVTFPAFSRLNSDKGALSKAYFTAIEAVSLLAIPAGTFVLIFSGELILVLLGPQWSGSESPLQILSMVGAVGVIAKVADDLLRGSGNTTIHAVVYPVTAALIFVGALAAIPFGLVWVAGVTLGANLIRMLTLLCFASSFVVGKWYRHALAFAPSCICATVVGISLRLLHDVLTETGHNAVTSIAWGIAGFCMIWVLTLLVLPGSIASQVRSAIASRVALLRGK